MRTVYVWRPLHSRSPNLCEVQDARLCLNRRVQNTVHSQQKWSGLQTWQIMQEILEAEKFQPHKSALVFNSDNAGGLLRFRCNVCLVIINANANVSPRMRNDSPVQWRPPGGSQRVARRESICPHCCTYTKQKIN